MITLAIISGLGIAVGSVLIYRNNQKRIEAKTAALAAAAVAAEDKAKAVLDVIKK